MAEQERGVVPLRPSSPLQPHDPPFRTAPINIEAEQALLGAILVNNAAYWRVTEFLEPEHFAEGVHGRIYAAIARLVDRGHIANPVSLKNLFDDDGALAEIGGAAYLARIAASVVTIINAEDYGRTIFDLYLRRQLISICEDTVNTAYD
jgi:replicative DNA helicase